MAHSVCWSQANDVKAETGGDCDCCTAGFPGNSLDLAGLFAEDMATAVGNIQAAVCTVVSVTRLPL